MLKIIKMHRRGGKRIRMDEPPPEYESPMTPAVEHEHYANYGHSNAIYSDSYGEQGGGTSSSDGMFESPPTPGLRRITRSKARGIVAPPPVLTAASHSPTSSSVPTRGRGRGRPAGRKNHADGIHSGEDETSLYHIIRTSKASLTNIVDDWIESYKVSVYVFCIAIIIDKLYRFMLSDI